MVVFWSARKKIDAGQIACALLILFGSIHLGILILNHYFIRCYGFDYSVYNFAFYDYAHFRVSPCPFYLFPYDVTFLQDHFSLTLMFLSPLYWLLGPITGGYSLLIIQTCIVVCGGWAGYRFIQLKTGNQLLSIFTLVYYFILLGRYTAAAGDCNIVIIGAALVPIFLYYFEKGKFGIALLFFLFIIFNREDFSLWFLFIAVFMMIQYRHDAKRFKLSLLLFVLSIICFLFIFKIIIPALEDENKKYTLFNFAALGKTPAEALVFILKHPLKTFELLYINQTGSNYYDGIKQEFYLIFFGSGGLLLVLRPLYFIPFIPLLAKKMFNDEPIRWSFESFYWVECVSIMPILVFWGIATIKYENLKVPLGLLVCICTLWITLYEITKPAEKHLALLGDTKKFNFLNKQFYRAEDDLKGIYAAMKLIPDTAIVAASGKLSTHLALRKRIYYFPRVDDATYVFLLKKNDNWPISQGRVDTLVHELIFQKSWKVLADKKDFVLIHKD
jgi:hypothetical protein